MARLINHTPYVVWSYRLTLWAGAADLLRSKTEFRSLAILKEIGRLGSG